METKYYLPISSKCLAHYFGSACIMPSKYFQNKPYDLQNKFEDFLLLTNNVGTNETDCCVELVLIEQESKDLINIKEGFFLYQKPLPISRIKKVLFSDKQQMEQTIANITMSTAFVPDKLIQKISKFDFAETSSLEIPKNIKIKDWSLEIKQYNSFLGGFALMRLAGEEYMNFSENYFSALSFFNDVIKNQLAVAGRNVNERVFDVFTGKGFFEKLQPILTKIVDEDDLNQIAVEEGQKIVKDKITRIIDLNYLDKATYIVAVLNTYGVGDEAKKKKIDGLILSNFKSGIKPEKSEVVALCYGLNKGYSVFANKYKLDNTEKIVKFQLNSLLDYYTIESLYQYCINKNTKSDKFPYLDKLFAKYPEKNILNKTDYRILDVIVRGKKKPKKTTLQIFTEKFQLFFQEYFGIKSWENVYRQFERQDLEKFAFEIKEEIIEEYRSQIEEELSLKYQKQLSEIRNDYEQEKNKLFLLLRKCDETLFDEVDKNKNGILEYDEVTEFVNKLNEAKKIQRDQIKIEKENQPKHVNETSKRKNYKKGKAELANLEIDESSDNLSNNDNLEKKEQKKFSPSEISEYPAQLDTKPINKEPTLQANKQSFDNWMLKDYIEQGLETAKKHTISTIESEFRKNNIQFENFKSIGELIIKLYNIPVSESKKNNLAQLLTTYSNDPKNALRKIAEEKKVPYENEDADLVLKILGQEEKNLSDLFS